MIVELILFGLVIGFISGFFGIGGGILAPVLVVIGFTMKEAVSVTIMQMVFSSIYGSFINSKKVKGVFKDGIILGIGGSLGGFLNSYVHSLVSNLFLQYVFIAIIILTTIGIFITPTQQGEQREEKNKLFLILIGFFVGIIAMSVGVGGSMMLIPFLVGFMKYPFKTATSLGLFFIIFSSIAGFSSLLLSGNMLLKEGFIIGLGSLVGVFFGIKVKNIVDIASYKNSILVMNLIILAIMIYKTIF